MKRFTAFLLTALLLCASLAFSPSGLAERQRKNGHIEGYVIGDFESGDTGRWVGFSASDPAEYETYNVCLTTYAAAYCKGRIYGYVYGYDDNGVLNDYFYNINVSNRVISYPEGASSGGEFVYGMAYDITSETMYALCDENDPYIASVDLNTGALTKVVDIALGSALGVQTLAIDDEGGFYLLTFAAISSKLVRLDIDTGELTQVLDTGMPCFYAQSMTFDHESGLIYWAHVNERTSSTNGLYAIDLNDNSLTYLGNIGGGLELTGLLTITDEEPEHYMPGDVNNDGTVDSIDALLALRAAAGIETLSDPAFEAADVDQNGSIDSIDAIMILRFALGIIDSL